MFYWSHHKQIRSNNIITDSLPCSKAKLTIISVFLLPYNLGALVTAQDFIVMGVAQTEQKDGPWLHVLQFKA